MNVFLWMYVDVVAPTLEILSTPASTLNKTSTRSIIIYWNGIKYTAAEYFYLWYKCDDKESLTRMPSGSTNIRVNNVGMCLSSAKER